MRKPSVKIRIKKRRFLAALSQSGNVSRALDQCRIDSRCAYVWRKVDPAFAAKWDLALEQGVDKLLDEAQRRAYDGVDEPVFYLGGVCGTVRKYSDSLLMFLIKGRRPQYATERREVSGRDGKPIEQDITHYTDAEINERFNALTAQIAGAEAVGGDPEAQ